MPQLDKFIFFDQIISFTAFFTLIYMYIRGTFIPRISTWLKFRRKKMWDIRRRIWVFETGAKNHTQYFGRTGLSYLDKINDNISEISNYSQSEFNNKLNSLNNDVKSVLVKNNNALFTVLKKKEELVRLNKIINN